MVALKFLGRVRVWGGKYVWVKERKMSDPVRSNLTPRSWRIRLSRGHVFSISSK